MFFVNNTDYLFLKKSKQYPIKKKKDPGVKENLSLAMHWLNGVSLCAKRVSSSGQVAELLSRSQ